MTAAPPSELSWNEVSHGRNAHDPGLSAVAAVRPIWNQGHLPSPRQSRDARMVVSTPVAHIIGVLFRESPEIIPTYDSF